jgi:hypothetical protein
MRIVAVLACFAISTCILAEPPKETLLELAKAKFASRKLTDAEEGLFIAAEQGYYFSALTGDTEQDDPENAASWSNDRIIHAECLEWLCTDREASKRVTFLGIHIIGVRIDGIVGLNSAKVSFPIKASGCAFTQDIHLQFAHLSVLILENRTHIKMLRADGIKVDGPLFLRGLVSRDGGVTLNGATIGGSLECDAAQIHGRELPDCSEPTCKAPSLLMEMARINGSVFLRRGFIAQGEVDLVGATIRGGLSCEGEFSNPNGFAIDASESKIGGQVAIERGTKIDGHVGFFATQVDGPFFIQEVSSTENTVFNLQFAKVNTLRDTDKSWPSDGNLFLDGFTYDRIDDPMSVDRRLKWLRLQPHQQFFPQPYEQLATVLRNSGLDAQARRVLIAKNEQQRRFTNRFSQDWWWYNVFGWLIGYGYAPWRAFVISLLVIGFGGIVFKIGYRNCLISPTDEKGYRKENEHFVKDTKGKRVIADEYPKFNAFIYSLEAFTPLLKLGQSSNWAPNANLGETSKWRFNLRSGGLLRLYLWFHIIAGSVLTTLWVGGLTGLVKT